MALNGAILTGLAIVAQIDSMRYARERLRHALQHEFSQYRMVLLLPAMPEPRSAPSAEVIKKTRAPKRGDRLKAAGEALLGKMDPALAAFVQEHQALETIVKDELTRDIDTGVLDLSALLRSSRLLVSFDLDSALRIVAPHIEVSSGVPSIDHLAMELVMLLEKYPILWALKGVHKISASIVLEEEQVKIILTAVPEDPSGIEEIRKRIQGALALLQMSWPKEDYEFVLLNSQLIADSEQIQLSKDFEKGPLIEYLRRFFQEVPSEVK